MLAVTAAGAAAEVPPTISGWASLIEEASQRFAVPAAWIERVMAAESGGRVTLDGRPIRSRVGAIGLMQLMPDTWQDMRATYHLGSNPDDPHDNILAGTAYLRLMFDRFGYPGLFAAYNAGPGRYATAIATGRRLPDETLAYLATVTGFATTLPAPRRRAAMQTLFVVRNEGSGSAIPDTAPAADGLFVARGSGSPGP
jgi:soluble lytic murein transglycosylase-like protein